MKAAIALVVFTCLLVACGGGERPTPSTMPSPTKPGAQSPSGLTTVELLQQASAALFGGDGTVHITVAGARSNQVLEYSQAWVEQLDDRVRLDINDERRSGDPNRPDAELIVDGIRHIGLAKDARPIDPLAVLLPLEHFLLVSPATEAEVSVGERSGSIVLERSYPESTHIEVQCAADVRVYFDKRSLLPTRVEQEQHACAKVIVPNVPHAIVAADLRYDALAPTDVPADFFDPQAYQDAFLTERLSEIRDGTFSAYWLGTAGLTDVWPQIDPMRGSGARFYYGEEEGTLVIESFPPDTNFAEPCPLRDSGIVVGRVPVELIQTALGPAEYCPTDGWLRIVANSTRVYLWPGLEHDETKGDMVSTANKLRAVG